MTKDAGFTLVEMLIIMAVIAILGAVALPNFTVWRENSQLNSAVRDMYSNFQKAKIEAVKRQTYCTVTFGSDNYVIYVDSNKNFVQDAGEEVIISVSLSDYGAVSYDTSEGGGDGLLFSNPTNGIAFSANGLPKSSAGVGSGSVYLKHDNNRTARLVVSPAGSIRLE